MTATSSGMAEFCAGCATAEEMLLARDVLMFFGCQVEASLHMPWTARQLVGSADAKASGRSKRWKCERCGYNRWSMQRQSRSRQLSRRTTVDLGTKTLVYSEFFLTTCDDMKEVMQHRKRSWTRGDKQLTRSKAYAMDTVPFGVRSVTIPSG